jgi:manganese-dependent ADP-ribose/CDP-alcohol diphosphatase
MNECNEKPVVVFGLFTDVQYADIDDASIHENKCYRYYRSSLKLVKNAVDYWKKYEDKTNTQIKFIIQLGDLIDGKCKNINDSHASLQRVIKVMQKLFSNSHEKTDLTAISNDTEVKLFHIWGNHEFYNFTRNEIIDMPLNTARELKQNTNSPNANYYFYDLTSNLRLVCLDFYEFSMLGYDEDHEMYKAASAFLKKFNYNDDLNSSENLPEEHQNYLAFNGALTQKQFDWLGEQLNYSKMNNKKVIVCGHIPICRDASGKRSVSFDSEKILNLLWSFGSTCVAYFAGHYHAGGFFKDQNNLIHLTFPAIVETKPDSNSFATIQVFEKKILIEQVLDKIEIIQIEI